MGQESNGSRNYGSRVHQASGMVAAQAGCPMAAALALIVDYAILHECSVDVTATDVIERRIRFGAN